MSRLVAVIDDTLSFDPVAWNEIISATCFLPMRPYVNMSTSRSDVVPGCPEIAATSVAVITIDPDGVPVVSRGPVDGHDVPSRRADLDVNTNPCLTPQWHQEKAQQCGSDDDIVEFLHGDLLLIKKFLLLDHLFATVLRNPCATFHILISVTCFS